MTCGFRPSANTVLTFVHGNESKWTLCKPWKPLTLLVLKIEYPRITNSVICLLLHWLFSSGHQHPWVWMWHINVSSFITRKDFKHKHYLIVIQMVENSNFNICSSNIKSLWPSDPIWWQGTTPSHCLNQSWLITSEILCQSAEGNSTGDISIINF